MPQIRELTSTADGLSPSNIGVDATAQAARRIGSEYDSAANAVRTVGGAFAHNLGTSIKDIGEVVVQHVDFDDKSKVLVASTSATADLTRRWEERLKGNGLNPNDPNYVPPADPNDPTIAQQFLEKEIEPTLEKLQDIPVGENGQNFARDRSAQLRQHFTEKLHADMSTMAGEAAVTNARRSVASLSNLVTESPDFHTVRMALDTAKQNGDVAGSAPTLNGVQANHVRSEITYNGSVQIVHAAAVAAIGKSPNPEATASAFAKEFPEYIKGDEVNQLAKIAKGQQKANLLTDKQLQQYQKQQQTAEANTALSKAWTDNVKFDENGNVSVKPGYFKDIMQIEQKRPGLATERAKTFINWAQQQQREKKVNIVTDRPTQSSLYDGLFKTDNPTTDVDILKAAASDKLDAHDTSTLLQLHKALEEAPLKGPLYQGVMGASKDILGAGIIADGHERYANFLQTFIPEYLRQKRAGTLPANALDTRDPESLISKSMAPFKPDAKQLMMGHILKNLHIDASSIGDLTSLGQGAAPLPHVTTKEQRDALKPGTKYIAPDGTERTR